ncbi:MAG: hypothetical protein H6646_08120 [Anaerolineales bacterium]|nr:hypothetical protein [Anaerolineales bacterium]
MAGWLYAITDFPTTPDALAAAPLGGVDGCHATGAAGDALMWSTYLGGSSDDHAWGIAGDTVVIVGETTRQTSQ